MPVTQSTRVKPVITSCVELVDSHPATAIKVLNAVFKEAKDDRLCKIATPVLQSLARFVDQQSELVLKDSKVTQLVVNVFKSL